MPPILSRLQKIYFSRASKKEISDYLIENLKVKRDGTNVSYFYKEDGGKYQTLTSNDNLTSDPAAVRIGSISVAPEFPKVTANFADFNFKCN